jgi:hypothetical protein
VALRPRLWPGLPLSRLYCCFSAIPSVLATTLSRQTSVMNPVGECLGLCGVFSYTMADLSIFMHIIVSDTQHPPGLAAHVANFFLARLFRGGPGR